MTMAPMIEQDENTLSVHATEIFVTATPWGSWPGGLEDSVFLRIGLVGPQAELCAVVSKTEAEAIANAILKVAHQ